MGIIFAVAVLWVVLSYYIFNRYHLDIEVYKAEVPEICYEATRLRKSNPIGWIYGEYRDFVPEHTFADFCGVIETSHGWMKLPHTRPWNPFNGKRARLLKAIKPGCHYKVSVYGFFEPKRTDGNRGTNAPAEILRIHYAYPCDT